MKITNRNILAACAAALAVQWTAAAQSVVTQPLLIGPLTVREDYTAVGSGQGAPGQTYSVQATASLISQAWTTICTQTADAGGFISFADLDAPNFQMRFYRLAPGSSSAPIAPLYLYALKAKQSIVLSGGAHVDSFDSADANYSLNGSYDPARHKANAYLLSESAAAGSINVGTGDVFGYVETWPGSHTVRIAGGAVGNNSWVSNRVNAARIERRHFLSTNLKDIADVALPAGLTSAAGGLTPAASVIGGTNYSYLLGDGQVYVDGNFSLSGSQSLVITGQATWYVAGSFTVSGSAFIYLSPGASLTLYVGSSNPKANNSITISGGGIINGTGNAANLAIYGLPSVKVATFSGSAALIGTGNMPEANVTISGSAGACGAFVGNNFTISGGASFHYDESLGRP